MAGFIVGEYGYYPQHHRIDIFNSNANRHGFVFNKDLQLAPSPAMYPPPDTFTCFNFGTNMGQVLHRYFGCPCFLSHFNDYFAVLVIDMLNPLLLPARCLSKLFLAL